MHAPLPAGTNLLDLDVNRRVIDVAAAAGVHIYMVGGFLRDAMLGRAVTAKDFDYAVSQTSAFAFAKEVADKLNGHFVPLDESNDIARVVLSKDDGTIIDFAGCVGGTIESDVRRRDLTINALVWSPDAPQVVTDLVGGLDDLKSKTIRAISEQAFREDPLRVLRVFRFAASLPGTIEPQTLEWVKRYAPNLVNVAAERINVELFQTLAHPCADMVVSMGDLGIIETIFPELTATRNVTANAFHHLGLFEHSLETIAQFESRLPSLPDWVLGATQSELSAGVNRCAATKVACILHDIGKPETWVINEEGRHTFYGHDHLGADMCVVVAQRMKWSRPLERFVVKLVKWHLRPGALFHQGPPTDKAIRRFYRSVGVDTPELMLLAFADFGATRGPGLSGENRTLLENSMLELLHGYRLFQEEDRVRVRFLNGTQIMNLLSLTPGPIVGELLGALDEAQTFKEVSNAAQAEAFVKQVYLEKYCK